MRNAQDIEQVISDIGTLITENIQTYIDEMNAARTDIVLEDFNSDAFLSWELDFALPYPIFYFLAPSQKIKVESCSYGGTAVNYKVSFAICIQETGRQDMTKLIHRYITILIKLFNAIIVKEYSSCQIVEINTVPFELDTDNGTRKFEAPMISIEVPIAF